MKLIIDSNILLDVLYARGPHFEKSLSVWRLCEAGKLQGFVSVLTFANIVYIMRKELDEEKIKDCWEKLFQNICLCRFTGCGCCYGNKKKRQGF